MKPTPAEQLTALLDRLAAKYGDEIPEEGAAVDPDELQAVLDDKQEASK